MGKTRLTESPTPLATGQDATAGGMALVPGSGAASDLDLYDNQTRDYIANGPKHWKSGVTAVKVAQGGTGATTASAARNNLGLGTGAVYDASQSQEPGNLVRRWSDGYFTANSPTQSSHVATKGYVDTHLRELEQRLETLVSQLEQRLAQLEAG